MGDNGRNETFEYTEAPDGVCITRYLGDAETLTIPDAIDGKPVRELGEYAFYDESVKLRKAVVPGSVRKVGPYAFAMCSYLEEIVLEEGVEELCEAFAQSTAVEKIRIPASVKEIATPEEIEFSIIVDEASPYFTGDGFGLYRKEEDGLRLLCVDPEIEKETYEVANGTTAIEKYALHGNGRLTSVILPATLKEIPESTLSGSKRTGGAGEGIEEINVNGWQQNAPFFTWDGCLYKRRGEITDGIELIYAFRKRRMLTLPRDVAAIDEFALTNCGAEILTVTSEQIDIHRNAFRGCPLREIVLASQSRIDEGEPLRIMFPTSVAHLREDLMEGFGAGEEFYDFTVYDRTLAEAYLSRERIDMILNRLEYPDCMADGMREKLLSRIKGEWEKCLDIIVKEDDRDAVAAICEQDLLKAEELDEWIRYLSEFGEGFGTSAKDKMVSFIGYKNEKFGETRHDYSL
ncbi:MAG: leucine-rich repeat protein [Firmicutes bacterium]|nr:leucine-rich repeat protein [Bacillota bacterium]